MKSNDHLITLVQLLGVVLALTATWPSWESMLASSLGASDKSAAIIALPLAAYLFWNVRRELEFTQSGNVYGAFLLLIGVLLFGFGVTLRGTIMTQSGAVLICFGALSGIVSSSSFTKLIPVGVTAMFAVELPGILRSLVSIPLAKLNAFLVSGLLRWSGIESEAQGALISFDDVRLQVVDACDGLRFFWSVLLMTIAICSIQRVKLGTMITLLLATPLVAVCCNSIRIGMVAIAFQVLPASKAERFHDASSWLMMAAAWLVPIIGIRFLPDANSKEPRDLGCFPSTNRPSTEEAISQRVGVNVALLFLPLSALAITQFGNESRQPAIAIESIDNSLHSIPFRMIDYVATEYRIDKRQLAQLRPDALLSRRYTCLESDAEFLAILTFHDDGRSHSGHNVPSCYGALGWHVKAVESFDQAGIQTQCFALDRYRRGVNERLVVHEASIGVASEMDRTALLDDGQLLRLQLVFQPKIPPSEQRQLTREFLRELRRRFET